MTKFLFFSLLAIFNIGKCAGQEQPKPEIAALQFFFDSLFLLNENPFMKNKKIIIDQQFSNDYHDYLMTGFFCFDHANLRKIGRGLSKKTLSTRKEIDMSSLNLPTSISKNITLKKFKSSTRIRKKLAIHVNEYIFDDTNYWVLIDVFSSEYASLYFFEISPQNKVLKWCVKNMIF